MTGFEDVVDIFMSYDTDIEFNGGDLKLTRDIDLIRRRVFKLLMSKPGDWKLHPMEGAMPDEFIGVPNTRENAQLLKEFLWSKIQPHVRPAILTCDIVPIDKESVKCYLNINMFGIEEETIPFTLDFINGIVYSSFDDSVDTIVSSKSTKFNDSESLKNPNPYWERLRNQ